MILRNAAYNKQGGIDCEVSHHKYGWIPYTIPKDGGFETIAMFQLAAQTAAPYEADPEKELSDAQTRKIDDINMMYAEAINEVIRGYPEEEQATWLAQEREARAYLAWYELQEGMAPETPVLDNILLGRNGVDGSETLQELCLAVLENADLFATAQQLTGKRQRLVKSVRAAEALDAVESIRW